MTTNSCKAWILAARPKTLTGAAAPVIVGGAYALSLMRGKPQCVDTSIGHPWIPFLIALIFALIMQVEANFVNDYFDFRKGTDRDDRLGPERACAQGWVTPHAMRMALVITALLAFIVGLPLIVYGGWTMLIVGLACILFCWLYTTHLSYKGLGDVLVLVFFGLVPVVFTCYVMTRCVTPRLLLLGLAMGLATDCLLIVNNYRDIDQDRISGKRTLIVMTGRKVGLGLYLGCGLIAAVINLILIGWWGLLLLAYLALHIKTYLSMSRLTGKALNGVLGSTARNIFVFGLLTAIALIVV